MEFYDSIPTFDDNRKLIRASRNEENTQRVFIFVKPNGTWGAHLEKYSNRENEECWYGQDIAGTCDSEQTAIKEVESRFSWASFSNTENNDSENI